MRKEKPHIWESSNHNLVHTALKSKQLLCHSTKAQRVPRGHHISTPFWSLCVKVQSVAKMVGFDPCLTYHGWFNEAPGVALRYVGLEDTRRAPGLVHTSEHVNLPSAHRGRRRMDRLRKRRNCLPLVGYSVVPGWVKKKEESYLLFFKMFCFFYYSYYITVHSSSFNLGLIRIKKQRKRYQEIKEETQVKVQTWLMSKVMTTILLSWSTGI